MTIGRGSASQLGYRREAIVYNPTWPGQAIALDAVLPFLSESITEEIQFADDESLLGGVAAPGADITGRRAAGEATFQLRYKGFLFLLTAALGYQAKRIGSTVMPEQLTTGVYRHLIEVDKRLGGEAWQAGDGFLAGTELTAGQQKVRRGTLAVNKQVSAWELRSAMIDQLTLRGTPARVEAQARFVGYSLSRNSAVNTPMTMATLTPATTRNVLFSELVVRLAPYSTSTPLGSGDTQKISQFEVSVANNLATDDQTTTSGLYIEEPERNGRLAVSGSFTLPRYQSDALLNRLDASTYLMADFTWTGPEIGSTGYFYQIKVYVPYLLLKTGEAQVGGSDLLPISHDWTAYTPPATPAGFPTNKKGGPILIEVITDESAHPLL